ncbi:8 TM domain-containing transmembrane protein [Acrasis kona]|uniref:8 TM domain-containing transmembrane protein n=1 Tax=Acrasis kona TaxID=1008807 RepID=A0AAW2ZQJ2_9EUKA
MSRQRTYTALVDVLPSFVILAAFFVFFLSVLGSIGIIAFAPTVKQVYTHKATIDGDYSGFFNGAHSIIQESNVLGKVNKTNQEITFSILLKERTVNKLNKNDLYLNTSIQGLSDDKWIDIHQSQSLQRSISCDSSSSQYFCSPIVTYLTRYIEYKEYRVITTLSGIGAVYKAELLEDVIFSQIETTNSNYTTFEMTLRSIFTIMSVIVTLYYSLMLFRMQTWSYCKVEQKWIMVLLPSLIMFNNPLFLVNDVYLFTLIDIVFQSSCVCLLLLFVLIMSHSAVLPMHNGTQRRSFNFYLPKLLLVACLWLLITVTLIWERFNEIADPIHEIPFFGQVNMAIAMIGLIIFLLVVYYTIRAVAGDDVFYEALLKLDRSDAHDTRSNFRQHYVSQYSISAKYKFFLGLTVLVCMVLGVDFVTFLMKDDVNSAAQYLSMFPLLNYYVITLALFFLPSNQQEVILSDHVLTSGAFFGDDDDEEYQARGMLDDASMMTPIEEYEDDDQLRSRES